MTRPSGLFELQSRGYQAPAPGLTGVHAQGRQDGLLFELTLRQTYRNSSEQVLEVAYTFPLPAQAVLLGIASELNGKRCEGVVVEAEPAEARYEEALAAGDAPVLLEQLPGGLHTASIGNLAPGDELVLEVRYAQMLSFEQGRLRWSIPTTIAPRYGNPVAAGLQQHQVPETRLTAGYPLVLSLSVGPALAGARLECPTHPFSITQTADGTQQLDLAPGAWLDRDVVFVATPREPRPSLVVQAADPFDAQVPGLVMVALQPAPQAPREAVSLRLLVDCSGSMHGDSIASARAALRGLVAGLSPRDQFSLSCFGDRVEHLQPPAAATASTLRRLVPLIDGLAADRGGTEMASALDAVFALPAAEGAEAVDVLLITDGEIWRAEPTIEKARQGRHRVFVIGVGSSPGEAVLRAMAQATGGACEFATPGEALEAAAQRMLQRMRQPVLRNGRIDWGREPAWQSPLPRSVFAGDTVTAYAGFGSRAPATTIRLLADDAQGRTVEQARGEATATVAGDTLPRMAAAARLAGAEPGQVLKWALRYQLLSAGTRCVLVHTREAADKPQEAATFHKVPSMMAAGWGGTGSVLMSRARAAASDSPFYDMFSDTFGQPSMHSYRASARAGMGFDTFFDLTAFEVKPDGDAGPSIPNSPLDNLILGLNLGPEINRLALQVLARLPAPPRPTGLALRCVHEALPPVIREAMAEARQDLNRNEVWVVFAHWANSRPNGLADPALAAALQPFLSALDPARLAKVLDLFERKLARHSGYAMA